MLNYSTVGTENRNQLQHGKQEPVRFFWKNCSARTALSRPPTDPPTRSTPITPVTPVTPTA